MMQFQMFLQQLIPAMEFGTALMRRWQCCLLSCTVVTEGIFAKLSEKLLIGDFGALSSSWRPNRGQEMRSAVKGLRD